MTLADDMARLRLLEMERLDMARIIGVLVERAGGEVTILPAELAYARAIERKEIPYSGAVVVRSKAEGIGT